MSHCVTRGRALSCLGATHSRLLCSLLTVHHQILNVASHALGTPTRTQQVRITSCHSPRASFRALILLRSHDLSISQYHLLQGAECMSNSDLNDKGLLFSDIEKPRGCCCWLAGDSRPWVGISACSQPSLRVPEMPLQPQPTGRASEARSRGLPGAASFWPRPFL